MQARILIAAAVALMFGLPAGISQTRAMPKVGDSAPLFTGQDQDGKTVKLADLVSKKNRVALFLSEGFHQRLHQGSLRFPGSHE